MIQTNKSERKKPISDKTKEKVPNANNSTKRKRQIVPSKSTTLTTPKIIDNQV